MSGEELKEVPQEERSKYEEVVKRFDDKVRGFFEDGLYCEMEYMWVTCQTITEELIEKCKECGHNCGEVILASIEADRKRKEEFLTEE